MCDKGPLGRPNGGWPYSEDRMEQGTARCGQGGPVLWEGGVGRAAGLWVGLSGGASGHSEGFLQGQDLVPAKLQQHCSGLRTRAGLGRGQP